MGRSIPLHGRSGVLLNAFRVLVSGVLILGAYLDADLDADGFGFGAGVALAIPPAPVPAQGFVPIGLSHPAPSPNGRDLAFVFAGDLWLTSIDGGAASRLLTTAEDEERPFWSPDGRLLLFARHEGRTQNLFLLDRETGAVRRLTEHEAVDVPSGFSPEGRTVLFHSDRSGEHRLYEVNVKGGEPRPVMYDLSADACWIASDELVYVRSRMPWWRQRSRGAGAGELFRFSRGPERPQAVTSFEGVDLWPSYDARGDFLYYASEESFIRNVWRVRLESGVHTQITTHRTGAVDFPQVDRSGARLFYEQGGSIWRVDFSADPAERKPSAARQLRIRCSPPLQASRLQRWSAGARGLWVGPQSGSLVLEADGHLFSLSGGSGSGSVRSSDAMPGSTGGGGFAGDSEFPGGSEPVGDSGFPGGGESVVVDDREGPDFRNDSGVRGWTPLAPSSYREDSPSWSPDGTRLVVTTDRAGQQDLLFVESGTKGVPVLASADVKVRAFRSSFRNEYAPRFSPDGRFVAYLRQYEEVEQLLLVTLRADERSFSPRVSVSKELPLLPTVVGLPMPSGIGAATPRFTSSHFSVVANTTSRFTPQTTSNRVGHRMAATCSFFLTGRVAVTSGLSLFIGTMPSRRAVGPGRSRRARPPNRVSPLISSVWPIVCFR